VRQDSRPAPHGDLHPVRRRPGNIWRTGGVGLATWALPGDLLFAWRLFAPGVVLECGCFWGVTMATLTPRGSTLPEPAHEQGKRNGFDAALIREQLKRILASSAFHSSRRCSNFLRYVVEHTLEGRPEMLKERTIGSEVFSRPVDYDTGTDHIVRSVAGEVRKRLAQYYTDAATDEIRIELPTGSYIPQFRAPVRHETAETGANGQQTSTDTTALDTVLLQSERRHPGRHPMLLAAGLAVLLAIAAVGALALFNASTALDRFWNPILDSPEPVMLCFGGGRTVDQTPEQLLELPLGDYERLPFRRMHILDAQALARFVGLFERARKPHRVLSAYMTSLRDLQSGPYVLIGALNNEWTMQLTQGLRFYFEREASVGRVRDKRNPSNTSWAVDYRTPIGQVGRDYAVVSRVRDPKTERTAVVAAGIASWGTLAAAEFLTDPAQLKKIESLAPRRWERGNLQVVLATDLIRGSSGPPQVLAAHFW
jgi:hypothetical protein